MALSPAATKTGNPRGKDTTTWEQYSPASFQNTNNVPQVDFCAELHDDSQMLNKSIQ